MDPLSIGRERYRQKDYAEALKAFSEAVKIVSGHLRLAALDNRAATYEKLGQLQSALRDSKEMIDMSPEAAKGYLRCGKVLQLRNDETLALKIYERGLKKVKIGTDGDRPILQKMFAKLQQKQEPSKNLDPLVMLPVEIAQMVCSHFTMRDLAICLAVSRPWKRFLESIHDLWTTIDLRSVRRPISQASLKAHLRRSDYKLKRAMFRTVLGDITDGKLKYLTRTCKHLEYLAVLQGHIGESLIQALPFASNLKYLILGKRSVVTLPGLAQILAASPSLHTAEFHGVNPNHASWTASWPAMNSLKTLVLSQLEENYLCDLRLAELITSTPNMLSFSLTGWETRSVQGLFDFTTWTHLEEVNLSGSYFNFIPRLPSTLKVLDLSRLYHLQPDHLIVATHDQIDLPNLSFLDISDSHAISSRCLLEIILPSLKTHNLQRLYTRDLHEYLNPVLLTDKLPIAPSVLELSLQRFQLSDSELLSLLRRFPNVRRLDLSETAITGVTIKELMARGTKHPEHLRLFNCYALSPDAVEYARRMNVRVDYKPPSLDRSESNRAWRNRIW